MQARSFARYSSTLLVACATALALPGAHALTGETAEPDVAPTIDSALIRIHKDTAGGAVRPAAAPQEPVMESDRATQMSPSEREIARARRLERREIISEGIGIPLDDLNDLLRRVRPAPEERRQAN